MVIRRKGGPGSLENSGGIPLNSPRTKLSCSFLINFFFFFLLRWVFVATRGLSLVAASGGYSVAVHGLLIAVASLVAEYRL